MGSAARQLEREEILVVPHSVFLLPSFATQTSASIYFYSVSTFCILQVRIEKVCTMSLRGLMHKT